MDRKLKSLVIPSNCVGLAEGWIEGTEEEVLQAWQHLHSSGLAYQLQGWFGRTAQALLSQGLIQ